LCQILSMIASWDRLDASPEWTGHVKGRDSKGSVTQISEF